MSQSFVNTLHGRKTAAPSIRSTGLGRNTRKGAIQENAHWSTKANKHKVSKSLQNGVKRSIVYNHRVKAHSLQNKRNCGNLKNSQKISYINFQIDHDNFRKQWLHPAERAILIDEDITQEDPTHINIYTDGSKSE